jgi:hypothetical protein
MYFLEAVFFANIREGLRPVIHLDSKARFMRHITVRGTIALDASLLVPETAAILFAAVTKIIRHILTGSAIAGLTLLAPINASAAPVHNMPLLPPAASPRNLTAVTLHNAFEQILHVGTSHVQSELIAGAPLFDLTYADFQSTLASAPASDQAALTEQFLSALSAITPEDDLGDDNEPELQSVRFRAAVLAYAGLVAVLGAPHDYRQTMTIANGMRYAGEITRTLQGAAPKLNTDPNRLALIAADLALHGYLLQALTVPLDGQGDPLPSPSDRSLRHTTQLALAGMNLAYARATPLPTPVLSAQVKGPFNATSQISNAKLAPDEPETVQSLIPAAPDRPFHRDETPDNLNDVAMNFLN